MGSYACGHYNESLGMKVVLRHAGLRDDSNSTRIHSLVPGS